MTLKKTRGNHESRIIKLKGAPVLVLGAGESGISCAQLLVKHGCDVRVSTQSPLANKIVRLFKRLNIAYEDQGHSGDFFAPCDLAVLSPGVKPNSKAINLLNKGKIKIAGEIEIASLFSKGQNFYITGSNGKTSSCLLLSEMIDAYKKSMPCGNIGESFSRSCLEQSPSMNRVIEVSSFQLHYSQRFDAWGAIIMNMSPNHLDWHPSLKHYYDSKMRALTLLDPSAKAFVNMDDKEICKRSDSICAQKIYYGMNWEGQGYYIEKGHVYKRVSSKIVKVADLNHANPKGKYDLANLLAVCSVAHEMKIPKRNIHMALKKRKVMQHRMQYIARVKQSNFINDSKSTTTASTKAALEAIGPKSILIAGGVAKQRNFRDIIPDLKANVSHLILYGDSRKLIKSQLPNSIRVTLIKDFTRATQKACSLAFPGSNVLLSPMCSSFDQFNSYEDRGEVFSSIVRDYAKQFT